jgi:enoyl-CoA hydratase
MDADVLTTRVVDGIAVITLGTERRIYIDQETSDALFEALSKCAGDPDIRVVIVTGAAPGSFVRHYSIPELIRFAESVRATGREWPEARFIDGPASLCERMPKPVIAAISGTCLAGAFELTLSCDLRIAEDGDYQIGFPETNFGLLPGAGGTQRLPRTIGMPAALMHILMGVPVSPREAERRGLVHETVSGHALDRAIQIARHLSSFTPESLAYIKRLVRSATDTPLAQGLLLERRLFMKLCLGDAALSRMRAYDEQDSASPSRVT